MPLLSTSRDIVPIGNPQTPVGLWTQTDLSDEPELIWVIVSAIGVEDFARANRTDLKLAIEVVSANRSRMERAASRRYDRFGIDDELGLLEGKAIVCVDTDDLN